MNTQNSSPTSDNTKKHRYLLIILGVILLSGSLVAIFIHFKPKSENPIYTHNSVSKKELESDQTLNLYENNNNADNEQSYLSNNIEIKEGIIDIDDVVANKEIKDEIYINNESKVIVEDNIDDDSNEEHKQNSSVADLKILDSENENEINDNSEKSDPSPNIKNPQERSPYASNDLPKQEEHKNPVVDIEKTIQITKSLGSVLVKNINELLTLIKENNFLNVIINLSSIDVDFKNKGVDFQIFLKDYIKKLLELTERLNDNQLLNLILCCYNESLVITGKVVKNLLFTRSISLSKIWCKKFVVKLKENILKIDSFLSLNILNNDELNNNRIIDKRNNINNNKESREKQHGNINYYNDKELKNDILNKNFQNNVDPFDVISIKQLNKELVTGIRSTMKNFIFKIKLNRINPLIYKLNTFVSFNDLKLKNRIELGKKYRRYFKLLVSNPDRDNKEIKNKTDYNNPIYEEILKLKSYIHGLKTNAQQNDTTITEIDKLVEKFIENLQNDIITFLKAINTVLGDLCKTIEENSDNWFVNNVETDSNNNQHVSYYDSLFDFFAPKHKDEKKVETSTDNFKSEECKRDSSNDLLSNNYFKDNYNSIQYFTDALDKLIQIFNLYKDKMPDYEEIWFKISININNVQTNKNFDKIKRSSKNEQNVRLHGALLYKSINLNVCVQSLSNFINFYSSLKELFAKGKEEQEYITVMTYLINKIIEINDLFN